MVERTIGWAEKFAVNPLIVTIASICTIAGFVWLVYDKAAGSQSLFSVVLFSLPLVVLVFLIYYSLQIRLENAALKDIASTFNEINRLYRESLRDAFGEGSAVTREDLLGEEEKVLRSVCQRIENIFVRVTYKNCMVTVKLLVGTEAGNPGNPHMRYVAETYVRSEEGCVRDTPKKEKYEVNTGKNTAFDAALGVKPDGVPRHFFSPDLTKEKDYSNQRNNYLEFYRSALIVPIGCSKGETGGYRAIGLLCVDTKSTHRLNSGYHLQMLLSLAGQMYDYISLMRGEYTYRIQENDI